MGHLDESQRAMVGARAKHLFEEVARGRMLAGVSPDPSANLREGSKAASDAASLVNVSPRSAKSDRWIAEKCAVGHAFVSKMRGELSTGDSSKPRTDKDGKTKGLRAFNACDTWFIHGE